MEVYREPRPVESYQQEAREAWEVAHQCQEELARVQAAPVGLTSLTALRVFGTLADDGVVTRNLTKVASRLRGDAFVVKHVRTYRAKRRVLVEFSLSASQTETPWSARDASLRGSRGELLKILSVWQESPVTTASPSWVLVEAEAAEFMSSESWTLRLTAEGRGRALVLDGIAFASAAGEGESG